MVEKRFHYQPLTEPLGLARSGHDVTLLEQAPEIAEVGAGIQVAPNSTRIMGRWGVLEELLKRMNLLGRNSLRRYKDGFEMAQATIMPIVAEKYGAPMGVIHRGDCQRCLLEAAKKVGAVIRTGCRVVKVDEKFEARVQLDSGEWVEGDVLIAADGIKSEIRRQIVAAHGSTDHAAPTGDAAYRLTIEKHRMKGDQQALKLLAENVGTRWYVKPKATAVNILC